MKREGSTKTYGRKRKFLETFFHLGVVVVFMALLIAGSTIYYYRSLQVQLFSERQTHLTEMAIKISEVIDITVEAMQDKAGYASSYVYNADISNGEELVRSLANLADMMDLGDEQILALDTHGHYYSSERKMGRWSNMEDYAFDESVPVIRDFSVHGEKKSCMVFFEKLESSKFIDKGDNELSHVAVVIPIDNMKKYLSVSIFGDECFTYLVNKDGRVLYKQTYANKFIENYNALSALREYRFTMGGDIEDLKNAVSDRERFCAEFVDEGESGENYFVSTVPVADSTWTVLLFVPTRILGVQTNNFITSFIIYISVIAFAVIVIVACLIFTVITIKNNRKMMEQQENTNVILAQAAKEAQSANVAKSEFLSHMSHDIRTPINGIIGMTNIAMKNTDNMDKVMDCLEKISGAADHLLTLINDVLDMSRIESRKMVVSKEPIDIRFLINDCASIIDGQIISRELDFEKEFEDFKHPFVLGDELHIRQVIINILGNAVKFTNDGGKITFRVKEMWDRDEKVMYRFEVEDTGIGIGEEFQNKIFEAFSQENDDSRTTYKGTGLGMAISKQLVELMGGTISLRSKLGEGSCFTVELEFDINSESQNEISNHEKIKLNGMKVLLVEDNALNMEIAQELLNDEGIEVTPVENGKIAVDVFTASAPGTFNAILMDILMPVMNGLDATRAIRNSSHPEAKTIPIIAMTANAYKEDEEKALEAGMNAHVAKPVNIEILLSVLGRYI